MGMGPATVDLQKGLDTHNAARAKKGVQALIWSDSLAAEAQAYADQLLSTGVLKHSNVEGEGENLASFGFPPGATGVTNPAEAGTQNWLSEESAYDGQPLSKDSYKLCGHFSTYCVQFPPFYITSYSLPPSISGLWVTHILL
jgi:cysteine-rich secretory family protein